MTQFKNNDAKQLFAARLKAKLIERDMNQNTLATLLGVSESTIGKWTLAKSMPRTMGLIERICAIFNVEKSYFLEEQPPAPSATAGPRHGVKIPILGRVIAGLPAYADQEIIGYDEITEERARTGEYFALIVRGDSMEPLFYEGDHVIIERQPDVDNGEIAIVGVDGDDATIKRIRKVDGGIILQPENRAYEPMFFSNKDIMERPVTIYGKVVEQRRTKF